ncbi:hypothetical protein AYI69_g2643 [Smittium culicis]|uniref:Uncharacterized protein n=1 Tax=Smittium culicis TaxID=133412 RepID=A0A1R1YM08_9FUNG|nr:hypothetical protein AYI69_g2643 [Smittium culicis]
MNKESSDAITKEATSLLAKNEIEQFSSVWTLTESSHLYKGAMSSTKFKPISRNQCNGIFGQPFNNRKIQGKIFREYKKIILQIKPTGVQDQDGEVQNDTISIDYLSGDDDKLTEYEFKSPIRQGEGSQTRGQQADQSWENNTEKL